MVALPSARPLRRQRPLPPRRHTLGSDIHISRSCYCFGSRSRYCSTLALGPLSGLLLLLLFAASLALALACAATLLLLGMLLHEQQILLWLEPLQLLSEMLLHDQLLWLSHALLLLLLLLFCY